MRCSEARCSALHKKSNPTHGSVWIGSDPFYNQLISSLARVARWLFKTRVFRQDLNNPHTSACGIRFTLHDLGLSGIVESPFCTKSQEAAQKLTNRSYPGPFGRFKLLFFWTHLYGQKGENLFFAGTN